MIPKTIKHLTEPMWESLNQAYKSLKLNFEDGDWFRDSAKRALKTKKCGESDNIETLTVSPYSPKKTLKFSHTVIYEVS